MLPVIRRVQCRYTAARGNGFEGFPERHPQAPAAAARSSHTPACLGNAERAIELWSVTNKDLFSRFHPLHRHDLNDGKTCTYSGHCDLLLANVSYFQCTK